jgi:hypothetical protein
VIVPASATKRLPKGLSIRVTPSDRILKALMGIFGNEE